MARRNKASGFCFGSPLRLAELRSPPLRAETETPSESTFLEEPADPSYRTIYRKNVTPNTHEGAAAVEDGEFPVIANVSVE